MYNAMQFGSIAAGAMLGANLRFFIGNWAADRWAPEFPYGTFAINVSGAFVIGFFLALLANRVGINPLWRLFFCDVLGDYTTCRSYKWGALTSVQSVEWPRAVIYVVGRSAVGMVGVSFGATLAQVIPSSWGTA